MTNVDRVHFFSEISPCGPVVEASGKHKGIDMDVIDRVLHCMHGKYKEFGKWVGSSNKFIPFWPTLHMTLGLDKNHYFANSNT